MAARLVADSASSSAPLWVLVGLVLVVLVVVGRRLLRRRRLGAWRTAYEQDRVEATWFARELLWDMQAADTPAAVREVWSGGAPRVSALKQELSLLLGRALDLRCAQDANRLFEAVRDSGEQAQRVAAMAPSDVVSQLAAAQRRLETALVPGPAGAPMKGLPSAPIDWLGTG